MGGTRGKCVYPAGKPSIEDIISSFYYQTTDVCSLGHYGDLEEVCDVAVLDSVYEPGDAVPEDVEIGRTIDRVPDDDRDMSGWHGIAVSNIISYTSNNIRLNFIRVLQDGGDRLRVTTKQLLWGLKLAKDHDMDVLNLSLGNDHSDDGNLDCGRDNHPCRVRKAIRELVVEEGITVIAASGDSKSSERICCPGRAGEVICVGGFISKCTAKLSQNGFNEPSIHERPPNAIWIDRDDDKGTDEILCGGEGCSALHECRSHRRNVAWDNNLAEEGSKPDVYAPSLLPVNSEENGGVIVAGSSFATPFVTSQLAEMIAGAKNQNEDIQPALLREAVVSTARLLDSGEEKQFYASGALTYVCKRVDDLEPPKVKPRFSVDSDPLDGD